MATAEEHATFRELSYELTEAVFGKAAAANQRAEDLSRDLALAESRIEQLEGQLVATGAVDPQLGP
jgi:hypothetical protein